MKLKKIVSLALAGVLAVSMLAGCSNNGSNSNSSSSSEQTTVTGAAAALNAVQNFISFKDSTSAVLTAATQKAVYSDLDAAPAVTTVKAPVSDTTDKVYADLKLELTGKDNLLTAVAAFADDAKAGSTAKKTYLYLVDDTLSQEVIMTYIANSGLLDATKYPATSTDDSKTYKATYTGEVSMEKVTKSDNNGKTASAYYVLITVTQTVGDTAIANA